MIVTIIAEKPLKPDAWECVQRLCGSDDAESCLIFKDEIADTKSGNLHFTHTPNHEGGEFKFQRNFK